jgi:hypothetical protein
MQKQLRDAYFSGLIDGEGCILIEGNGSKRLKHNGMKNRMSSIQVKMTCEKTIIALRDHFGVGTITCCKPRKIGYKTAWRWRVLCKQGREVADIIRPYLITKADALQIAFPEGEVFKDLRLRENGGGWHMKLRNVVDATVETI